MSVCVLNPFLFDILSNGKFVLPYLSHPYIPKNKCWQIFDLIETKKTRLHMFILHHTVLSKMANNEKYVYLKSMCYWIAL